MSRPDFDVLIVGGGLAGLACACLLRHLPGKPAAAWRVGVLETRPPAAPDPDADIGLRVFAIAPAGRDILAACGAWSALPPGRAAAYERMRVWHESGTPFGPGSLGFDAAELGRPELGHIVEHDWLRLVLWQSLTGGDGPPVEVLAGAQPAGLEPGPDAMAVRLADGALLRTRLIVGADGSKSWVRDQLRLRVTGRDYAQLALIGHVRSERPHEHTAWQRFTRTGPVALLPLADGRSSIVWSCFAEEARELAALPDGAFAGRLTGATGGVLGALEATTPRVALPLAAGHTHRYTGPRFALIGDAAHQIHPLAGQGINLGLLDAAVLAETLAGHLAGMRLADPGDALVLRRYERRRKGANLLTMAAMEGLHRLFTSRPAAVPRLGAAGLGIVDRLASVKRLLAEQAAGTTAGVLQERHARL